MNTETYGRGQVEWALWQTFNRAHINPRAEVPKIFRNRVKRLIDLDRTEEFLDAAVQPVDRYAFVAPPEGGELLYTVKDAFRLAIAMDLLDLGFNQAEIVFLIRHYRKTLDRKFNSFRASSKVEQPKYIRYYGDKSGKREPRKKGQPDSRTFLIVQKAGLLDKDLSARQKGVPALYDPEICAGIDAMANRLDLLMPDERRGVAILEIAGTAQAVTEWLSEAPEIQRGRPKK